MFGYIGDLRTTTSAVFERRADGFAHLETLPTGRRPMGLSVSPDGSAVFIAHSLDQIEVRKSSRRRRL
jgi:DNA-binding beta-propeller fold protein YncE